MANTYLYAGAASPFYVSLLQMELQQVGLEFKLLTLEEFKNNIWLRSRTDIESPAIIEGNLITGHAIVYDTPETVNSFLKRNGGLVRVYRMLARTPCNGHQRSTTKGL